MYCIAGQCVLPPLSQEQAEAVLIEAGLQSPSAVFEAMPAVWGRHGLRYDLSFFLTCLVAALWCNCDSREAVAQWCRAHRCLLREVFGPGSF